MLFTNINEKKSTPTIAGFWPEVGFLKAPGYTVAAVTVLRLLSSQFPRFGFNEGKYTHLAGSALAISVIFQGVNFVVSNIANSWDLKRFKDYDLEISGVLSMIIGWVVATSHEERGFLPSQYKILLLGLSALSFLHVNYRNRIDCYQNMIMEETRKRLDLEVKMEKQFNFVFQELQKLKSMN